MIYFLIIVYKSHSNTWAWQPTTTFIIIYTHAIRDSKGEEREDLSRKFQETYRHYLNYLEIKIS